MKPMNCRILSLSVTVKSAIMPILRPSSIYQKDTIMLNNVEIKSRSYLLIIKKDNSQKNYTKSEFFYASHNRQMYST